MRGQKRIRDYGIVIGELETGEKNAITDVQGVKVGHVTLDKDNVKTGVTAIIPQEGNLFKEKLLGACHVINGFGKTMGTIQIEELGTIETPIILTNTLSVGICADGLIEYMLDQNDDIGRTTGTVNPIVCECNDGYLNDIRGGHVKKLHVFEALESCETDFLEGDVGAGKGMSCFHLKGGIGSSSRKIRFDNESYTLGTLVLSNFGSLKYLTIDGTKAGKIINSIKDNNNETEDKGSVIIIIATDIPLSERQLKRISKRAVVGLSKTGSYIGNGSGDIVISFTTANRIKHYEMEPTVNIKILNEDKIDIVFRAVAESVEESVLNSLICANTVKGRDGHIRNSLREYINIILNDKEE